jgi:outer membrane receptor protein involved in Fe transport
VEVFALRETFDAFFSAISEDRNAETLTRSQRVPAQSAGAQATFRRALDRRHLLLAGMDFTAVKGASDEIPFVAGAPAGRVRVDGSQNRGGFYVQDLFQAAETLEIVAGIRLDTWDDHSAISPKVAARLEISPSVGLRGSMSRSFRAPTLNELYRSFRVGNIVTAANPALGPERATSGEVGIDWVLRSEFSLRATGFWAGIEGNIANVTISTSPTLIRRERRNLGDTRSRGIELDAVYRPHPRWVLSAGYFLSDATVRTAPQAPELVGLRVPQVPRHQGVFQAGYAAAGGFFANIQVRVSSMQFDDDRNLFPLDGYGIMELSVGRSVHRHADLFFACENLWDESYPVGRTPVLTLGMPRRVHGGLRFHFE